MQLSFSNLISLSISLKRLFFFSFRKYHSKYLVSSEDYTFPFPFHITQWGREKLIHGSSDPKLTIIIPFFFLWCLEHPDTILSNLYAFPSFFSASTFSSPKKHWPSLLASEFQNPLFTMKPLGRNTKSYPSYKLHYKMLLLFLFKTSRLIFWEWSKWNNVILIFIPDKEKT